MSAFTTKLIDRANTELANYHGVVEHHSPLKERIGQYWSFVGHHHLDGSDDVPWSAAFISYMVHLAGGDHQFPYSAQHSTYFYRTINDCILKKSRPFLGYRLSEVTVQPGDIIGMNRATAGAISYDWATHHADYQSHADIVVDVAGRHVHTIGGNVSPRPGSVGEKRFTLAGGRLKNDAAASQEVFVVIRSFLP